MNSTRVKTAARPIPAAELRGIRRAASGRFCWKKRRLRRHCFYGAIHPRCRAAGHSGVQPVKTVLYLVTKSNWGGAQRYVYDLATALPREGFAVAVVYGQPGRLAQELTTSGITTYRIRSLQRDMSIKADVKSFFELLRLFRSERPDIVHLNSSKAGGIGALAARIAGVKKIIFTAHGWPFWEQRNSGARIALWFFSWFTVLLSHRTICVSNADFRATQQMPLVGSKTIRIYNGITRSEFLPRQESSRIRVLTNAELHSNKNLFIGIDAVIQAHVRDAAITYSIMSDGELRPALEQYVARKNANSFISFLGFVPEGRRYYKNYEIFFLPSKKEGLPYVLLEAGMAGLPVVASNVGGIPEIIEDTVSGMLKSPADIEGFANALVTLAKNPVLRAQLGNNLKEKVEKQFSLKQMMDETLALYRA